MFYITVKLFGLSGRRGEFRAYEEKALAIFRRHGGEVVAAYTPLPDASIAEMPDEIQILRIADRQAFDGFMKNPERRAMAAERESVIRKTEVFLSGEHAGY